MSKEEQKKPKYNKWKFIVTFCVTMILFAAIRHGFSLDVPLHNTEVHDAVAMVTEEPDTEEVTTEQTDPEESLDAVALDDTIESDTSTIPSSQLQNNAHRIIGVHSWTGAFPDVQDVQIKSAMANGIHPCATRQEALQLIKRHKLVDISNSPFYVLDDLRHSMPYLVPKAQHLLNTICLNFIDSLQAKGLPPHLPMVTSVLRTTEDVSKLQRGNRNATTNSCHCYGTTVDITYNRFVPIIGAYDPNIELTRWSLPFKQVMAEVLRDLREQNRCYVKYEYKQACFHLTVR